MPRWYWAAAFVPLFFVVAWLWATSRLPSPGEAPIAASERAPGSLSGPSVADRAREQVQRELAKLITTLADSHKQLTAGLLTLREDLQAVRGEVRELQGAAARRAETARPRRPRKARPQPVSAAQPSWRWLW